MSNTYTWTEFFELHVNEMEDWIKANCELVETTQSKSHHYQEDNLYIDTTGIDLYPFNDFYFGIYMETSKTLDYEVTRKVVYCKHSKTDSRTLSYILEKYLVLEDKGCKENEGKQYGSCNTDPDCEVNYQHFNFQVNEHNTKKLAEQLESELPQKGAAPKKRTNKI